MSSIYDRTDIYDLLEDQTHWSAYKKHWKTLLQGKNVHSFLDVSIGSGSVTSVSYTHLDVYKRQSMYRPLNADGPDAEPLLFYYNGR